MEDTGALDERQLVERARSHDMDAFDVLYRRYVQPIHAFAYRRSGSVAVADDVTSATFERALRNLHAFRWTGGGWSAWLHRIAANELADHYRGEAKHRSPRTARALAAVPDAPADERVLDDADARAVREALGRLRPRYQRALALRYFAELGPDEAAEAMGVSKRTMNVIVHRAVGALRRELGAT